MPNDAIDLEACWKHTNKAFKAACDDLAVKESHTTGIHMLVDRPGLERIDLLDILEADDPFLVGFFTYECGKRDTAIRKALDQVVGAK